MEINIENMKNILVTGAGAVLGQGILRCLNEVKGKYFIHTADPDRRSTGHWLGNKAHIIPFATDKEFLKRIEEIVKTEGIDAILVGTDVELPIFADVKQDLERKYNVAVIVSNRDVIDISNDKWKTSEFLKSNNMPYPYSYLTSDAKGIEILKEKNRYPYLAKPVDGARSKGLILVKDSSTLDTITAYPNNLVVQEFLSEDNGEYTAGCLVLQGKVRGVVTLRRDLRDGNTYRAYYENEYAKYTPFISSLALKLGVDGPCNFQFRIRDNQPVVFEINARFSGTTPIRSFFGFNEVTILLDSVLNGIDTEMTELKEGAVYRAWADIFVDKTVIDDFSEKKEWSNLAGKYHPFMN